MRATETFERNKKPRSFPGASVSLKQLAYLEMKRQTALEDMELKVGSGAGQRIKRAALAARQKDRAPHACVAKIDI